MPSKLGGQTGGLFASARQFFQSVQPACWKVYGNALGSEIAYRQWSPRTFIVGREVRGQQFAAEDPDPIGTANRYADLVIATAALHPAIDAWEFYNEPVINVSVDGAFDLAASIQASQRLNLAQLTFSRRLHAAGLKVVAYNLARGNPDYRLVPYLADGAAESDYIGLHAYFAPRFADDPENQALRYRKIMALLPAWARKPIIFTEYGTDFNGGGFRLEANHMTPDEFVASCRAWDAALMADAYVAGSCGFVFGADSGRWGTFEMSTEDVLPQLAEAMKDSVAVSAASVGEPVPPPVDPPPTGESMEPTPAQTVGVVPFLVKLAIQLELGQSLYGQYGTKADDGTLYDCWIFQRGGLRVKDGDFGSLENAKLFNPQTGELMADPLPWPGVNTPPQPTPPPNPARLLAFPQSYAPLHFKADWYMARTGERFFGLIAVTDPPVIDIGARLVFQVADLNGQPQAGAPVFHLFGDTFECFKTDGFGLAAFNLGSGSGYSVTDGSPPKDRFYIGTEYRSRDAGQPAAPPMGDVYYYGLPDGHHIDCTYSVRLMVR